MYYILLKALHRSASINTLAAASTISTVHYDNMGDTWNVFWFLKWSNGRTKRTYFVVKGSPFKGKGCETWKSFLWRYLHDTVFDLWIQLGWGCYLWSVKEQGRMWCLSCTLLACSHLVYQHTIGFLWKKSVFFLSLCLQGFPLLAETNPSLSKNSPYKMLVQDVQGVSLPGWSL